MSNLKPHIRISPTAVSPTLANEYGESYSPRYLRSFRQFYALFPDFDIWKSRFPNLTWTHIYRTLRVGDDTAIRWYLGEASEHSGKGEKQILNI